MKSSEGCHQTSPGKFKLLQWAIIGRQYSTILHAVWDTYNMMFVSESQTMSKTCQKDGKLYCNRELKGNILSQQTFKQFEGYHPIQKFPNAPLSLVLKSSSL